ncbi:capsular polysaccharide export protein, LipB/KpsS family [Sphingomonas abietis]|uniref:Beta-3-deoxy-D-manno-oct-2-ulosonic acid transferase n=1 Tax=Sphingomonas abietis TaxID=3012344 RepID=A0ABY7NND8_9SPHN|nr:beta-3-deoxy-D-manno-oct-2-ulosonic acid transferase [Sphingomonas abietis]WBO23044.1 beta-3-deoxy-D-manno-oct-2-ulosonic acid transferase [Sphingomonas abietis]
MTSAALLRAPPFPGVDAAITFAMTDSPPPPIAAPADPAGLFALLREARVGGRFWLDPAALARPAGTIVRPRRIADIAGHRDALSPAERGKAVWIAPASDTRWGDALARLVAADGGQWCRDVDPWSLLPGAPSLVAHGDDEWVALARIAGVPVHVLSPGRFGAPDEDGAALDRRAAAALAAAWRNPFTGDATTLDAIVDILAGWRAMLEANRTIVAACGMAWWKRDEIRRFLWHPQRPLRIVASPARALRIARDAGGAVAIWPSRASPALIASARAQAVPLVRVEDGFVRSVGLGVDLVPPSSVVVDHAGIHFDPSGPSDLELILAGAEISPKLAARARALREAIVAAGISKYSTGTGTPLHQRPSAAAASHRLILVPGQVEDDMSVRMGGGGLTSNLELLRRARALEPDAEIWFRPHPDVDAGHRKGAVPDADILAYADRIVRGGGMASLLDTVDAVHVLTSLTGFEALMRGREVTCHGTPFYAGWGLTRDLGVIPARRTRALTLDALVAGVLILYPRYLDPVTGLPCPPEILVGRMASARTPHRLGWIAPLRRWQGRLMAMLR